MKTKIKLSSVQIHIIELLQANEFRSVRPSNYHYGQEVIDCDGISVVKYFTKPTLNVLKRLKILVPQGNTGYRLSEIMPKLNERI